jgi:hypothetical protein
MPATIASLGIVGRRQALAGGDEVARRVVQHEVGEGAADIDADAGGAGRCGHRVHSRP